MELVYLSDGCYSMYGKLYDDLQAEKTKIAKKAFDVLDREGIAGIITTGKIFWFESYIRGNDCPQCVYDYLKRYIKRKYGYKYLYDKTV